MGIRTLAASACLVALLPAGAAAQQVGGGVKGGITFGDVPAISEAIDDPGATTSWQVGYAVGGFLAIRFGNGLSIQPEVLYTQKGVKFEAGDGGVAATLRYKVDYLDVPILVRLTFGKGLRGYVFGGPSLDFMRAAKMTAGFLGPGEEDVDISEDVEDFEFALVFGGGIELGPILLEARWSEGLTNVAKTGVDEPSIDVKTRTVLFLVGLRF